MILRISNENICCLKDNGREREKLTFARKVNERTVNWTQGNASFAIRFKKPQWHDTHTHTHTHTHAYHKWSEYIRTRDSKSYILFTSASLCKYVSRVHWNEQFHVTFMFQFYSVKKYNAAKKKKKRTKFFVSAKIKRNSFESRMCNARSLARYAPTNSIPFPMSQSGSSSNEIEKLSKSQTHFNRSFDCRLSTCYTCCWHPRSPSVIRIIVTLNLQI